MDENGGDYHNERPGDRHSRRSVAHGLLGAGLAVAFELTAGGAAVRAQATPQPEDGAPGEPGAVAEELAPSRFVLAAGATEIGFLPAAAGAPARLAYRDGTVSLRFEGDEITEERSAGLGRLVTVLIDFVADGYVRDLTLLVPDVNPVEDRPDVPISILAILTTHLTTIGGPAMVQGAVQTYEVIELEGTAEFVPAE